MEGKQVQTIMERGSDTHLVCACRGAVGHGGPATARRDDHGRGDGVAERQYPCVVFP